MNWWQELVLGIHARRLGDVASVAGVVISLVGFAATIFGVFRSKTAAEQAKEAAQQAKESVFKFDMIQDLAEAVTVMDEIKRLHRADAWAVLPDRYSLLRRLLLSISAGLPAHCGQYRAVLVGAVNQFRDIEGVVDRALQTGGAVPKVAKLNGIVSNEADKLQAILIAIKSETT